MSTNRGARFTPHPEDLRPLGSINSTLIFDNPLSESEVFFWLFRGRHALFPTSVSDLQGYFLRMVTQISTSLHPIFLSRPLMTQGHKIPSI